MAESWLPLVRTTWAPAPVSPHQGVVQQADDVDSRQCAVVDVPGDEDDVDCLFPDEGHELVDEGALGVQHADAVEGPAQVPVGGVQ